MAVIDDSNTPLVSIVVLTYNSGKFVLETLNSILSQDYPRIELLVSDDGSKDNTCEIVENWILENSKQFERCNLIKSFYNRGTCSNYNQGVFNSHGDYIKTIDGDDILNSNHAISDYVAYIKNSNHEICISDVEVFSNESFDMSFFEERYSYFFECVKESLEDQKRRIIRESALPDPGIFFSRKLYDRVNGFDENYKLQEEWPFFMKVLDLNYHIGALEKKLVRYRLSSSGVSHSSTKSYAIKMCVKDNLDFFIDKRLKRLLKEREYYLAINQFFHYFRSYIWQLL